MKSFESARYFRGRKWKGHAVVSKNVMVLLSIETILPFYFDHLISRYRVSNDNVDPFLLRLHAWSPFYDRIHRTLFQFKIKIQKEMTLSFFSTTDRFIGNVWYQYKQTCTILNIIITTKNETCCNLTIFFLTSSSK